MLYHSKLGLPKNLQLPRLRKKVIFTNHARAAAKADRYGDFSALLNLHNSFDPNSARLIEVETADNIHPTKLVYRLPLSPNSNRDLVLALVEYPTYYVAKTTWLNETGDSHATLNLNKYTKPAAR